MKIPNLLLNFLFFFFAFNVLGQGTLNYQVLVYDTDGKAKANLDIVLIETTTFARKSYKTSPSGQVSIQLNEGKAWMMHVGDMKNHTLLKMPPGTSNGSETITYDVVYWNRINEPPVDRSKLNLVLENQTVNARDMPKPGNSIIEIIAVNEAERPWQAMDVRLTCYKLNKTFVAKTDGRGVARFNVPNSNNYQVDLDGEIDFEHIDLGDRSTVKGLTLTYEKIDFEEIANADGYLEQRFKTTPKPISNRVMVTLFIQGGSKNGIHEDVYLTTNYGNQKYHGVTDDAGKVIFMLPKKRSYLVSFPFELNADILDLSRFRGIGYMQQGFRYQPDPRLEFPERYLPKASEVPSYDINSMLTKRYPDLPEDELINVHVKWGNNKINSGSKEALLELGFSVKEPPTTKGLSKPLNLAFVLDRSGSMGGQNMDLLKSAMLSFVDKLRPEDKVSLIFFDDAPVVAYPLSTPKKSELVDIISAVQAGGGTNIYDGLTMGYEELSKAYNPKAVNRVILLTDGYGSKPVDFVLEQSKKYFEKGISVSTIGVGYSYNQALLTLLSKYSGGLEHQVIQSDGLSDALLAEFESFNHPLATDLRVTVKYNNRVIYKTLYGIPEDKNSNGMVQFKLGQVFTSLNRMALMKFKIENPTKDIAKDKITIQINYFDEIKQKPVEVIKETHLEWTDETDIELIYDQQLKSVYSTAVINQAIKAIADLCDAQNYVAAKENVKATLKSLEKINSNQLSADLKPFIDELEVYLEALDRLINR